MGCDTSLMICSSRFWSAGGRVRRARRGQGGRTDLESLVLQDLLDGNVSRGHVSLEELCLEDDAEGAIADDFAVCVDEITLVAALAV